MCTYSVIADGWRDQLPYRYPQTFPQPSTIVTVPEISRTEFDALKREVKELKELLKAAKKFDAATGQPDCEMEEKVALLKQIAKLVGVELPI